MNIELIPYGKENKIIDMELVKKAKLGNREELRNEINELRKQHIILSERNNSGSYYYWRSNSKEELQEFIKKYQHRSYDNNRMIILAYKELEEMEK